MYDSEDPTAIFYLAGTNNVGNLLEVTTLKSWEMCQCKTTLHYRSSRVGPLGKLFENVRHLLKLSVYQRQIHVLFGNIYLDHGRFICTLFSEAACCCCWGGMVSCKKQSWPREKITQSITMLSEHTGISCFNQNTQTSNVLLHIRLKTKLKAFSIFLTCSDFLI